MLKGIIQSIFVIGFATAIHASEPTPTKKPINPVMTELADAIPGAPIDVLSLVAEYAAPQTINLMDAVKEVIAKYPTWGLPVPSKTLTITGFLPAIGEALNYRGIESVMFTDREEKYNPRYADSYRFGIKVNVIAAHLSSRDKGPCVVFMYNPALHKLEAIYASSTTTKYSYGYVGGGQPTGSSTYENWEVPFPYNDPSVAVPPFDYTFPNGLRLQAKKTGNDTFEWSAQMTSAASSSSSSAPATTVPTNAYTIIEAKYGAGSNQMDVTKKLNDVTGGKTYRFNGGSNSMNTLFGRDPIYGTVKQLVIKYQVPGEPTPRTITVQENNPFTLP